MANIGYGENVFSVSFYFCNLKIYLHSNKNINRDFQFQQSEQILWEFNLPQICSDEWHHYLIVVDKLMDNSLNPEV